MVIKTPWFLDMQDRNMKNHLNKTLTSRFFSLSNSLRFGSRVNVV